MSEISEIDLKILEDFILAKGDYWHLGGSINTYPKYTDERSKGIYEACCELERQGRIKRDSRSTEDMVIFVGMDK